MKGGVGLLVNLHVHSMFSLRDSIIRPEEIVPRLNEIGQDAIAITDHGNLYAGVSIYKELKQNNIKYIHGCEMYICDDTSVKDKGNRYYHLIVLCKNEVGRINLNKLITLSNRPENFYYKPRIDFEMLQQHKAGLLIMSACLAGEISRALTIGDNDKAIEIAKRYKSEFGEDFYIEVQSHSDEEQIQVNKQLLEVANILDIPAVVTTDAHYVRQGDKDYQNKYAFNGTYKEDGEAYIDCFIQSESEVRERLQYLDEKTVDSLIENTHKIADKCNVELPLSAPIMPEIDTPQEFENNKQWLKSICSKGFKDKLSIDLDNKSSFMPEFTQESVDEYIDRYEYELNALDKMGFIDYILLVYSYANKGKRRGIARGSGGGSLINYLTGITNIDPIQHGLYFERFIDVSALSKLESGEITAKELKIPDCYIVLFILPSTKHSLVCK